MAADSRLPRPLQGGNQQRKAEVRCLFEASQIEQLVVSPLILMKQLAFASCVLSASSGNLHGTLALSVTF